MDDFDEQAFGPWEQFENNCFLHLPKKKEDRNGIKLTSNVPKLLEPLKTWRKTSNNYFSVSTTTVLREAMIKRAKRNQEQALSTQPVVKNLPIYSDRNDFRIVFPEDHQSKPRNLSLIKENLQTIMRQTYNTINHRRQLRIVLRANFSIKEKPLRLQTIQQNVLSSTNNKGFQPSLDSFRTRSNVTTDISTRNSYIRLIHSENERNCIKNYYPYCPK